MSMDLPLVAIQVATGVSYFSWSAGASQLHAPVEAQRKRYARRVDRLRSITLSGKIKPHERATDDELEDLLLEQRPKTWADCQDGPRPCPWVSCKHHLYIEVNPVTGSVQFPFGHLEIDQLKHTCSIDAALDGPFTLEEVGELTNRTKERVRQIETKALTAFKAAGGSPSMIALTFDTWME